MQQKGPYFQNLLCKGMEWAESQPEEPASFMGSGDKLYDAGLPYGLLHQFPAEARPPALCDCNGIRVPQLCDRHR